MDDVKQQIIDRLQTANNILVTVSANPTVDQLSACIGLTLLLNKLNKHATAVFSGKVPSTIEFLKPEETLEDNTDSLRDFIIALDKGKADKLRYKVEDEVVKIFITPYKSSISEKDLIFSQGDFNVDVVMALGVREAQDLDNAITAHGRILHDAVVISVNTTAGGEVGSINWLNQGASGVSELVTTLATSLGPDMLDSQIATALLTGIVAETKRFSNEKTTPGTMTASAALLAAGANQQLVSKELGPENAPKPVAAEASAAAPEVAEKQSQDGELDVPHDGDDKPAKKNSKAPAKSADNMPIVVPEEIEPPKSDVPEEKPAEAKKPAETPAPETDNLDVDPEDEDKPSGEPAQQSAALVEHKSDESKQPHMKRIEPLPHEGEAPKPPKSEKSLAELLQEADDELNAPAPELPKPNPEPALAAEPVHQSVAEPSAPVIEVPPAPAHDEPLPEVQPGPGPGPVPVNVTPDPVVPLDAPQPTDAPVTDASASDQATDNKETLSDIEESVHSPHVDLAEAAEADVDNARKAVEDALKGAPEAVTPPLAAGAIPVDLDLGHNPPVGMPAVPPAPSPASDVPLPSDNGFSATPGLPDYLQTPGPAPAAPTNVPSMPPYEDLTSAPVPPTINVPPPQAQPATSTSLPPQGPPPPPVPPPMPGMGQ